MKHYMASTQVLTTNFSFYKSTFAIEDTQPAWHTVSRRHKKNTRGQKYKKEIFEHSILRGFFSVYSFSDSTSTLTKRYPFYNISVTSSSKKSHCPLDRPLSNSIKWLTIEYLVSIIYKTQLFKIPLFWLTL